MQPIRRIGLSSTKPADLLTGMGTASESLSDRRKALSESSCADIDVCIDAQGDIDPAAIRIVDALHSYTEFTPSGTGLRILVWATKPGPRCKHTKRKVELYESGRYPTVMGRHYPGAPTTIEQRQRELEVVYEDLFPEVAEQTENAASSDGKTNEVHHQNGEPTNFAQTTPSKLDDDALIQKAREAKGGAEFAALFDRGEH